MFFTLNLFKSIYNRLIPKLTISKSTLQYLNYKYNIFNLAIDNKINCYRFAVAEMIHIYIQSAFIYLFFAKYSKSLYVNVKYLIR